MGLERDYLVEIPSKQYSLATKRSYSTCGNITLNPNFITGFTDAEGSLL